MIEKWSPIVGYEGRYEVSDWGRVRSLLKGSMKILSPKSDKNGYLEVALHLNGQRSHRIGRLVAFSFLGQPPTNKHEVAHSDGKKNNNRISNIRWATKKENRSDDIKNGSRLYGERTSVAKLTEVEVKSIRLDSRKHHEIASNYGVSRSNITQIKNRTTWKHLG